MMECMPWEGGRTPEGYGMVWRSGQNRLVHREVWEAQFGPIPEGMVVHHECENRACMNPHHLALVTPSEHTIIHARKTHCPHGHPYTEENTYLRYGTQQMCRTCQRIRDTAKRRANGARAYKPRKRDNG